MNLVYAVVVILIIVFCLRIQEIVNYYYYILCESRNSYGLDFEPIL